ncbi:MAG: hypothetical protein KJO07_24500, partial [Deltaproteobacteria bacterium]|nr:hypothetical protein [Deltaproteobacteria bacterium]
MSRAHTWIGIVGGLAMTLAGTAHADNFGVRAKPAGVEKLIEVGQALLPTSLELDPLEGVLLDCPVVSDFSARFTPNDISLAWHDLQIDVGDGTLKAVVTLDLDIDGDLDATNVGCVADQSCDIRLIADQLTVTADLALMSGPDGIMVANSAIDLQVHKDDFDLDIDSCFLGNAIELLFFNWLVEGWSLGKIHDLIVEKAEEAVPGLIASKLGSSMPLHIEKGGFHIDASIGELLL